MLGSCLITLLLFLISMPLGGGGGGKSLECNSLTQEIWNWAIVRNVWLSATHIPGSSNDDAVQLSRDLKLDLEWMLSVHVFKRIVALFWATRHRSFC